MLEHTEVTTELVPVANPAEVTEPEVTATEGAPDQQEQDAKPAKTFSQEEVDALIAKRLAKEARRSEREIRQKLAEMQGQQTRPEPQREDFATDEAHERARLEHLIEQRAQERAERLAAERIEAQTRQSAASGFWSKVDEVSERLPDIEQAINDPTLPMSQHMAEFVMSSEVGPEVAYHLAKNRAKAQSLAQMGPIQAARELMRIESEIRAKPHARPSNAPEPITPVGNRGRATASAMPSDDDDIETWMRKEQARLRRR
jgi:hypothetical protein